MVVVVEAEAEREPDAAGGSGAEPGGRWLNALPVSELLAAPGFRELVGPVSLVPGELAHVLARDEPRLAPSPISLLRADAEVVPFEGREDIIDDLAAWCSQPVGCRDTPGR